MNAKKLGIIKDMDSTVLFNNRKQNMTYKLNTAKDVDSDEPGVYILNLPAGFRFDEESSPNDRSHVRGYDSMREMRSDIKAGNVIPCDCSGCNR